MKHGDKAANPKTGMTLDEVEALVKGARAAGLSGGSYATGIVTFGGARVKELTFNSPAGKPAAEEL